MSTATAAPPAKKPLSPRKRAQRIRWVQYGILAAILIAVAVSADWAQISSVFFRGDLITATLTQGLGNAMKNTIVYTIGAFVFGLVFGTVLALMRLSTVGPYRWIATAYIEFFRGLPAIVVLMAFGTATRKIVLPQAFRIITPPLTNEVILLTKDSSLAYILGLSGDAFELTKYGRDLANTYANLTPLVVAGFCYLIITLPLSIVVRRMEARQKKER